MLGRLTSGAVRTRNSLFYHPNRLSFFARRRAGSNRRLSRSKDTDGGGPAIDKSEPMVSKAKAVGIRSRTRLPKSHLANFFLGLARLLFIATLLFSMICNLHSSNLANFPREGSFWLSGRSQREAGRFLPISRRFPRAFGTVLAAQVGGVGFMRWSASWTRLLSRQRSRPWRSWTTVAQRQSVDRHNSAHDALLGNRGERGRHRIPGGTHQERFIVRSPLRKAVHGEGFGVLVF